MIKYTVFVFFQSLPLAMQAQLSIALLSQSLFQPASEEKVKCVHSYINGLVNLKNLQVKLNIKNANNNNIDT